jgi:hypothetical protein
MEGAHLQVRRWSGSLPLMPFRHPPWHAARSEAFLRNADKPGKGIGEAKRVSLYPSAG